MDRIETYKIYARVVECAGFTKAADSLSLPRSTVSTAILELEKRVGARLLHRTTRKVSPTIDGQAFYEKCKQIIYDFEETEATFKQTNETISGIIKIDVPNRIGSKIIAPALPQFLSLHPNIKVFLGATDRQVNLIEERVDCALRVGTLNDSALIARKIGDIKFINVASKTYFDNHIIPNHPHDLVNLEAIKYASPQSGKIEDWEWHENGETKFFELNGDLIVNNADTYIAACRAGLGLIQIPEFDVVQYLRNGELVEILPDYRPLPLPINILYPTKQHLSRRLKVFTDWLYDLIKAKCVI